MKHLLAFLLLLLLSTLASAQTYTWDDFVQELTSDEEFAEGEEQDEWMAYLEELKQIHEHPLNINTATIEELLMLPFLNEEQIEQIHAYIYLHGEMKTLGELRLLSLMDAQTRRYMQLFTVAEEVEKPKEKGLLKHLRNDFSTLMDIPLYYRKGHMVENGYKGDALYHRIRYEIGNRQLKAGFRMEKDAGERYYDSYGAYAMLKDVGFVRRAVVGDYRLGLGEGLVVGGNSWMSKVTPSMKMQSGLRPMTSVDETRFLRGAAATLGVTKELTVSLFTSFRSLDATLNADGEVKTLLSTGYHRTTSERASRGNTNSTVVGGNISWAHQKHLHLGLTGYYQQFDRTLRPGNEFYRRIYPQGKHFGAMGMNYGYKWYRLSLAGETAYSTEKQGWATLNRASWSPSRRYTLSAIQRYYAYQYYSFLSAAFGENNKVQNESGALIHLKAEPWDSWQIVTYADFFHHAWPRYRMTHSSTGQEFMAQLTHVLTHQHTLMIRYQLKRKEAADMMEPHHRAKVQWTYQADELWKLQTTALTHHVLGSGGYAVQQSVFFTLPKPALLAKLSLNYFHTDDYASRVYLYEPALYHCVTSGCYFGHGIHAALTARWTSKDSRFMLEGKYSLTRYFDRKEQSSGLQTIFSPQKNDISVQLRVKI